MRSVIALAGYWPAVQLLGLGRNDQDVFLGPMAEPVAVFLSRTAAQAQDRPTALDRGRYLDVVLGVVRFFRNFQDERGAIIDPYAEAERQYSTPCYAHCCAVLCAARPQLKAELLESGVRAMEWAVRSLAEGRAADDHGDFYTVKLMLALSYFREQVPSSRVRGWEEALRGLRPELCYRDVVERKGGYERVHNWNLVAVAGEYLRAKAGLGDGSFVRRYLPVQLERFSEHGMYVDPGNPVAYDVFARYPLALMAALGYAGEGRAKLWTHLLRGGWTALFCQSPLGEVPCGGRSAHHQWNEAAQAASFEILADQLWRAGYRAEAAAFKRGARLALQSVLRWIRPSQELWIVKNRFEPSARWGFESYSFHSQYNLLTASMLASAFTFANEEVPEGVSPADYGGFVLTLDDGERSDFEAPGFHKTVANCSGTYVLLEHAGDLRYNPTGLLRLHRRDARGLSDGSVNTSRYPKLRWLRETDGPQTLSLSPIWEFEEERDGLGLYGCDVLARRWDVTDSVAKDGEVRFTVTYRVPNGLEIVRRFRLVPGTVRVREEVRGDGARAGALWPLWVFDGVERGTIAVEPGAVQFRMAGALQRYEALAPEGCRISLREGQAPFRNGLLVGAEIWSDRNWVEYQVVLDKG
ncbi:MAG: hypothetical protein ONB23_10245 [candidate division KSB1 bacterium]|nr:hypothetical protein [candidate division KSB1 bacterium]